LSAGQVSERIYKGERPSPAVEAVLALIIERPSYPYKLWQRYQERFQELYPISKSRIYQIVDHLVEQGLADPMPTDCPTGRQPKVAYRATAGGARAYRAWLAAGLQVDPRRQELLLRLLSTGARDARTMLQIIDNYEREALDGIAGTRASRGRPTDLRGRLMEEEGRLQQEAQMKFIAFARRAIRAAEDGER
jgi:DNA-binding PadR family transcriptional regulator